MKKIKIRKHILTAVSYFIPAVAAAGLMQAIGRILGGATIASLAEPYGFADVIFTVGGLGMGILPMIMSTGIAYSISDRPGIAPGIMMGLVSNAIGTGFIGGMLGGFLVGLVVELIKKYLPLPNWAEGLRPVLIIPLLTTVICSLIMYYIIAVPVQAMMAALIAFLNNLSTSSMTLMGAVVGVLTGIDYGGPINKTVVAFIVSLPFDSIRENVVASLALSSMVTPFGLGLAFVLDKYLFKRNIFTINEKAAIKTALPMGFCMITEGSLPIIANDLVRTMICTGISGGIGGAILFALNVRTPAATGGMFVVPVNYNAPLTFTLVLAACSVLFAVIYVFIKKPLEQEKEDGDQKVIDESDVKFNF